MVGAVGSSWQVTDSSLHSPDFPSKVRLEASAHRRHREAEKNSVELEDLALTPSSSRFY